MKKPTLLIFCFAGCCFIFIWGNVNFRNENSYEIGGDRFSFSPNDVSFLWPVPEDSQGLASLFSASTKVGNTALWPKESFRKVIHAAEDTTGQGAGNYPQVAPGISFKLAGDTSLRIWENWKLVSFRVDPSAPSCDDISHGFGRIPQIRLVMQPVEMAEGSVKVYDYAVHLPYGFTIDSIRLDTSNSPDTTAFHAILKDLYKIKKKLAAPPNQVSTEGLLSVHPGLSNPEQAPVLRNELLNFFSKHIPEGELKFISFMGLPKRPEPWNFFTMLKPVYHQSLRGATFLTATPPINGRNRNWQKDFGVSTSPLFRLSASSQDSLNSRAIRKFKDPLKKDIPNIIANPKFSHVFNTDCISCHSETTRRQILKLGNNHKYEYTSKTLVSNEYLPNAQNIVRNFGWFGRRSGSGRPFISIRTANETERVLQYIENHYSLSGK